VKEASIFLIIFNKIMALNPQQFISIFELLLMHQRKDKEDQEETGDRGQKTENRKRILSVLRLSR